MIELTAKFREKVSNIKKLPKYMGNVSHVATKAQAITLIQKFRSGIIQNALGLKPLEQTSVDAKQKSGYTKPDTPLYGLGRRARDRSYINSLGIHKIKDGYSVRPSRKKHHDSDLTLQQLFRIHESGATIKTKTGMIRIPPRPAMARAFKKFQQASIKRMVTEFVRQAIRSGLDGEFNEAEKFRRQFAEWDDFDQ